MGVIDFQHLMDGFAVYWALFCVWMVVREIK